MSLNIYQIRVKPNNKNSILGTFMYVIIMIIISQYIKNAWEIISIFYWLSQIDKAINVFIRQSYGTKVCIFLIRSSLLEDNPN